MLQLLATISLPGTYIVSVTASNDVSSVSSSALLIAQWMIASVVAGIPDPVIQGQSTIFSLTVTNGNAFAINAVYGDGASAILNSANVCSWLAPITLPDSPFSMTCIIQYNYATAGTYAATFNVSNAYSWVTTDITAVVEPSISGVNISTTSPQFVRIGDTVTVSVVVSTGADLHFAWDFGDHSYIGPTVTRFVKY